MFGLRVVTKREMALWMAVIESQKAEIKRLQASCEHERSRAEAAINLVLMRTVKAVITPVDSGATQKETDDMIGRAMGIFGAPTAPPGDDDALLEKLQK